MIGPISSAVVVGFVLLRIVAIRVSPCAVRRSLPATWAVVGVSRYSIVKTGLVMGSFLTGVNVIH